MRSIFTLVVVIMSFFAHVIAQDNVFKESVVSTPSCALSDAFFEDVKRTALNNIAKYSIPSPKPSKGSLLLEWPLRPSDNYKGCSYFYISAYVDQDDNSGTYNDFNCGDISYDGHRGTDFVPTPFVWHMMDSNFVEVVAAASGILIAKVDGQFDRVCQPLGSEPANYVVIQHTDGSFGMYAHFKSGSLTAKSVGQSIEVGEYLGTIGSAGLSSGPHLHFQIYADNTFSTIVDPFEGFCNLTNVQGLWKSQIPYSVPALTNVTIHSQWPYKAVCPSTVDTLYQVNQFYSKSNASAVFYVSAKDISGGTTMQMRILNPDNSVFSSWDYTANQARLNMSVGWEKTLPTQSGVYSFEATCNGVSCATPFSIQYAVGIVQLDNQVNVYWDNPSSLISLVLPDNNQLYQFKVFNALGATVYEKEGVNSSVEFFLPMPTGIYYYTLSSQITRLQGKIRKD